MSVEISSVKEKFVKLQKKVNDLNNEKISLSSEVKTMNEGLTEISDKLKELTNKATIEQIREFYTSKKDTLQEKIIKVNEELDSYLDDGEENIFFNN